MNKSNRKKDLSFYLKKLNEIDVNLAISYLKNINLEDLKKIDTKELTKKIRKSTLFKPSLGLLGASFLFIVLLIPSFEQLLSTANKARKYRLAVKNLELDKQKLNKLQAKIKNSSLIISEINESIISKNDLIFVPKLINQTALKANVDIISILPLDIARSSKLCKSAKKINDTKKINAKRLRNKSKQPTLLNKGLFQTNFFEINLTSNYFDVIKFLNLIQNYDVVILPSCFEVNSVGNNKNSLTNQNQSENISSTMIIPLSKSGLPLELPSNYSQMIKDGSFNRVRSRFVIKIPTHSK